MPVTIAQITAAFDFANTGSSMGAFFAVVCKATGEIHYQTDMPDFADMYDELPDDIDDEEKYVALPHKRELGLGKPLVLDFARDTLPDDFDTIRYFFDRRGTIPNSRPCSPDEVRLTAGTRSKQRPLSRRCATGARCMTSKSSAEYRKPCRTCNRGRCRIPWPTERSCLSIPKPPPTV
jgi:hypothetical protein